jgi:hypothetical protein
MKDDYPESVTEVLDAAMTFRPAALQAMRAFADAKPWRGTVEERQAKFGEVNRALSAVYQLAEPQIAFDTLDDGTSGRSHYLPALHRIVLVGRMSVVSYLHEFGHARGFGERQACRWSINLFRRVFPGQFSRLIQVGHMLVHPRAIHRRTTPNPSSEAPGTSAATDK